MDDLKKLMWSNIDEMPIYNWFKLSSNSDFNMLLKVYEDKVNDKNRHIFNERSNELTQQYLDTFGADQQSEMLLVHLKSKIRLQCQLIRTGRKFIELQIQMVDAEIKKLLPTEESEGVSSLDGNLVRVSKFMGYGIKAKETSVTEYKHLLLLIEDENKKAEKWQSNQ